MRELRYFYQPKVDSFHYQLSILQPASLDSFMTRAVISVLNSYGIAFESSYRVTTYYYSVHDSLWPPTLKWTLKAERI